MIPVVPEQPMVLPDGQTFAFSAAPESFVAAQWDNRTALVTVAGLSLRLGLKLRAPERLRSAASHGGPLLQRAAPTTATPIVPLLALAYMTETGRLPSVYQLQLLRIVATLLPPIAAADGVARLATLRTFVRAQLAARGADWAVAGSPWDIARQLIAYGVAVWELSGDTCWWWATADISARTGDDMGRRLALTGLAAVLLTPERTHALPLPVHADADAMEVVLEWQALAYGPRPIPPAIVAEGLGALREDRFVRNPNGGNRDRVAVTIDTAVALGELAITLVAETDRPRPRYIGRALDVSLPPELLGPLGLWEIAGIRVVPHADGLWLAVLDARGQRLAAAWWAAAADNLGRAPLVFVPPCWTLLHPVCAALWHDLCADAIIVPPRPDLHTTPRSGEPRGRRVQSGTRVRRVLLPPVRSVPATWADAADRRLLAHACATGHGYRRLPSGWEHRQTRKDFQARKAAAAQRARTYGYPEPPPGFTYIRPFVRGLVGADPLAVPLAAEYKVRSRGLFTLLLGLQPIAAEAVDPLAVDSAATHTDGGAATEGGG